MLKDEKVREALTHCLQVLDMAAGEGLHYRADDETFDAGDAVFELASALGVDIANVSDVPALLVSSLLSTPPAQAEASTLPGKVDSELIARVKHVAHATGKDRWKIANLTGYDWRRILAALEASPPTTPAVESGGPIEARAEELAQRIERSALRASEQDVEINSRAIQAAINGETT